MSSRILLVEDNADLAYGLRNNLEIEGYQVDVAGDGQTGLDRARATHPDLLVLDLMLPAMDGFRVLKALRDDGARFPILILTARGEESDKVQGLKLGADDYVTKPFGVLELLARGEALLLRSTNGSAGERAVTPFGAVEVGGGVPAGAQSRGAQGALHHGRDRPLAVGARDVDGSEGPLGMAQRLQERADVVEAELDAELFEREEPFDGGHCGSVPVRS